MASSDVSSVTKFFATAAEGFNTTLGSTIVSGATSVPLNSTVGLTNGSVFVGIIEPGATAQQVFTGTVDVSGSQITNVVWTRGTNVGHAGGVTIVDYSTGTARNMTTTGILKQHTQAGAHTGITTDTIATTGNATIGGNETVAGTLGVTGATTLTGAVSGAGFSMLNMINPYKFSVYLAADSSALSSGVWTKALLDTKTFDTHSDFDAVTNHRFVVPATGFYYIGGQIGVSSAGATSGVTLSAALYKNGSSIVYTSTVPGSGSASQIPRHVVTGIFSLTAGDYLELYANIGEGGRVISGGSTITFLSGFLVSAS